MTRRGRSAALALVLALSALAAGVSGCKKQGGAERAGRKIDQAVEKTGRQLEHAGDNLKHAIKDLKK